MKNILFVLLLILTQSLWAVCTAPISRTPAGANSVLTSTRYNLELNTVYNRSNNLPGDCIVDESISGSKLIDGTVGATKLATDSVTTAKIADGSITAAKLAAAIENLVPVGTILPYGGTTAPSGYLICNGQSISRATYANLYGVLGNAFGTIDGVSFNIPDLRGKFLRMVDGGAAYDPDRATRTALKTGGNTGDNVGSLQTYQVQAHYHIEGLVYQNGAQISAMFGSTPHSYPGGLTGMATASVGNSQDIYTSTVGGNETRPVNVNVNYIIKY